MCMQALTIEDHSRSLLSNELEYKYLLCKASRTCASRVQCLFFKREVIYARTTRNISTMAQVASSSEPLKKSDQLDLSPERVKLIQQELDEQGYTVIPGVVANDECDDYIKQIKEWLAKFGENDHPEGFDSVVHDYNIAHHPVAWQVRLKSAPVFEALWGTPKIVTSTDGMSIGRPPESGKEKFFSGKLNLHLDQGRGKLGRHAYQGAVYLEEADDDDWCLAVMAKSHLHHQDYFAQRTAKDSRTEFCKLGKKEIDWYTGHGCPIKRIPVPRGGIILWDSRLVHAGARPVQNRENPGRWRFIVFVCMVPAFWASEKEMASKKSGFNKLRCSKHWPAQGFGLFRSKRKRPELNAVDELPEVALSKKARLLSGDKKYNFKSGPKGPPKPEVS